MTPTQLLALCTHAPYYQKGCLACSVRYVKMLRSPDKRLSRKLQEAHLASLAAPIAERVKAILREEA